METLCFVVLISWIATWHAFRNPREPLKTSKAKNPSGGCLASGLRPQSELARDQGGDGRFEEEIGAIDPAKISRPTSRRIGSERLRQSSAAALARAMVSPGNRRRDPERSRCSRYGREAERWPGLAPVPERRGRCRIRSADARPARIRSGRSSKV